MTRQVSLIAQLLAVLLATLPYPKSVLAQGSLTGLISLQDYINQKDVEKDPVALGYIASRCSALYAVFTKGVEAETDPERQGAYTEWTQTAENFMSMATRLMMSGATITFKDALDREKVIVVKLGNIYSDRIEDARLRTNNMFSDPLIFGDFTVCRALAQRTK